MDRAQIETHTDRWLDAALADGMTVDELIDAALRTAVAAAVAYGRSDVAVAARVAEMQADLPLIADAMVATTGRA